MGQQHRIGTAMGNMESSAQLMCHTVIDTQRRGIESKSCQTGSHMHLLTGMHILTVIITSGQEHTADFQSFLCQSSRKLIVLCAALWWTRA